MNCRKCGCEILETDERCPMCNALQRRVEKKIKKPRDRMRRKGQRLSVKEGLVLVGVFAVVTGFVIFHFNLFGQRRPHLSIAEMAVFINRIDGYTTGHLSVHMTETRVYIPGHHGDIIVFDHDMSYVETIKIDGDVMIFDHDGNHVGTRRLLNRDLEAGTLYVTDESIYFMSSSFGFLRQDLSTGQTEQISDFTRSQHVSAHFQYVPGIDGRWYYFNDPFNDDRFFYIDDIHETRSLYEVSINEESRNLIATDIVNMTVSAEYLVLVKRYRAFDNGVYLYQEATNSFRNLGFNLRWPGNVALIGDDLFINDADSGSGGILYHRSLSDGSVREIASDIQWFAVVGDYIIYQTLDWEDLNIYVMDFEGNHSRTLIGYEREWTEDGDGWNLIRIAP